MKEFLYIYRKKALYTLHHEGLLFLLFYFSIFCLRRVRRLFYIIFFYLHHYRLASKGEIKLSLEKTQMPAVSIIIPFRDTASVLQQCVTSLIGKTSYPNYELILVDNQSVELQTKQYLLDLKLNPRIKTFNYDQPFNFSAIHNWVMGQITSEYVLFLNNDTEIVDSKWLGHMMSIIQSKNVGVVGPLLLYPDQRIQHAGVAVGVYHETPKHVYVGELVSAPYADIYMKTREMSAVTGACMLTKRSVYMQVGGFDEAHLAISLNDIDYCLKVRDAGLKIIFTAQTHLIHHESYSRGYDFADFKKRKRASSEKRFFLKKWKCYADNDPFYNCSNDFYLLYLKIRNKLGR